MVKYKDYKCKHCGTKFKVSKHGVETAKKMAKKTGDSSFAITCPVCGSFPHTSVGTGVHRPEFANSITEEIFGGK